MHSRFRQLVTCTHRLCTNYCQNTAIKADLLGSSRHMGTAVTSVDRKLWEMFYVYEVLLCYVTIYI